MSFRTSFGCVIFQPIVMFIHGRMGSSVKLRDSALSIAVVSGVALLLHYVCPASPEASVRQ